MCVQVTTIRNSQFAIRESQFAIRESQFANRKWQLILDSLHNAKTFNPTYTPEM